MYNNHPKRSQKIDLQAQNLEEVSATNVKCFREIPEFVIVAQNAKDGRHLKTHCVTVFVLLRNGTFLDIHLLQNKV